MWVTKKKWLALEARVDNIEERVQSQPIPSLKINREPADQQKVKQWVEEAIKTAINC